MNDLDIKTKLIKCIKDTCAYDEDIKEIDNLKNDLGYDSLEIVSLIFEIEEAFDITFDSSDLTFENMETVKDLINLIKKTLAYESI